jgi:hypothetical protein
MKAKDIFGLAVRIAGLILLYQGLTAVPTAIASLCPSVAVPRFYFRNLFPALLMVGWPLAIGYWLVRGAPWLMRLAYREPGTEESSPEAKRLAQGGL